MKSNYDITEAKKFLRHALKRAHERCEILLTEKDLFEVSFLILQGQAILKRFDPFTRRGLYKVFYKGHSLFLIFDHIQLVPVTFYKHKWLKKFCSCASF